MIHLEECSSGSEQTINTTMKLFRTVPIACNTWYHLHSLRIETSTQTNLLGTELLACSSLPRKACVEV
jgi:hypothetical protein